MKLRDLKPGDVFTRVHGGYRYVVTDRVLERGSNNNDIYCHNLDGEKSGYTHPGREDVILLSSVPAQSCSVKPQPAHAPKPAPERKFWMCYRPGSGRNTPTYQHSSLSDADREAERLATEYGGQIYVLEATKYVGYSPPTGGHVKWHATY